MRGISREQDFATVSRMNPHDADQPHANEELQRWIQHRERWEETRREREDHIEACRHLMKAGILTRLEMASDAARKWGHEARVTGIYDTQTCTGVLHLRAKLVLHFGKGKFSRLEFIGSPQSRTIGIEGERTSTRKRWPKIPFTVDAIESNAGTIIHDFLCWSVK